MDDSRYTAFTGVLEGDECNLNLTSGAEGLGLEVIKAAACGDEIYRCKAVKVHKHTSQCDQVESFCKALSQPSFLPYTCYCAALGTLVTDSPEGTETSHDVTEMCEAFFSLCQPDRVADRAPGISRTEMGLQDVTALKVLQHFCISEKLLPLYTKLSRIWKYNAFDVGDGTMAIFLLPSLCNHSCSPAADYTIYVQEDGSVEMTLLAMRPLERGDALTISYIEENETHKNSRLVRRNTLAEGWLFYCQCLACQGPKDCGLQLPCSSCHQEMVVWISNMHGGPYEDTGEAPRCDVCGEEDLVVSGPYFFHCANCEMDLCPKCADPNEGRSGKSVAPEGPCE